MEDSHHQRTPSCRVCGRTGHLYLINPDTLEVTAIGGFSGSNSYNGGHEDGITSAGECGLFIVVNDRTQKTVALVDPETRKIAASSPLSSSPDYVRIETFHLSTAKNPSLQHKAFIEVPGGPESLVIDHTRQKAYTHLWAGKTVAIDLKMHATIAGWENGCRDSRGIALDEQKGFLFAGCAEGKTSVLDVAHTGKVVALL